MTAEEFLRWEHLGIAEWVDGEVITMSVTNDHQRIVDFLIQLIGIFCRVFNAGVVRSAPYAMRAVSGGSVREPDLMFIATANLARVRREALDGPADLVVEVVSEESVARDYDDKFSEYQEAGVGEYWIIDPRPNRQRASFFQRDANGRFQPVAVEDGIYHSAVLREFRLKLSWLWQTEPEPDALLALTDMIGAERLALALRERRP
jgi:Uma2 family endonuclease